MADMFKPSDSVVLKPFAHGPAERSIRGAQEQPPAGTGQGGSGRGGQHSMSKLNATLILSCGRLLGLRLLVACAVSYIDLPREATVWRVRARCAKFSYGDLDKALPKIYRDRELALERMAPSCNSLKTLRGLCRRRARPLSALHPNPYTPLSPGFLRWPRNDQLPRLAARVGWCDSLADRP